MVPRTFFAVATLCLPGALARAESGQSFLRRPEPTANDASSAAASSPLFELLAPQAADPQASVADLVDVDTPRADADTGFYRVVAR